MTSRVRFYHRNNTYCKPKEVIRVCLQKITLTFSHVCKEILIAEEAAFFYNHSNMIFVYYFNTHLVV